MNEDFELRNRLKSADPGSSAPALNETVVAKAALGKAPRFTSFRVARLTMAAASLSILGLAVTTVTLPQLNQEPLFVLAQGGQSGNTMAGQEASSMDAKMAPGVSMIWPGFSYNHIAGDLSKEAGTGRVYQAQLSGDPIQILNELADYFGISGEPKRDEWATDDFPSYSIQGDNLSLSIYFSGTGSWYYSNWTGATYGCESSSSEDGEVRSEDYCEPKPTPELIPNEADLVSQATKLFSELGVSVDASAARVWRDDWGASVSFPNVQLGINTGMDFYVGWGMDGKISYASGHTFKLIDRGEFKTISPYDAVARIADGRWYGGAPASFYEGMVTAYDTAAPATKDIAAEAEPAPAETEPAPDAEQEGSPEPDQIPQEPVVQDLLINRSEVATLTVFDSAGNLWLVPGYILYNDQGWFDSIISLEEGVIQLPEPYPVEIMPVEEPQG